MVNVQARFQQVKYAIKRGISQRRACTLLGVARSGLFYQCKQPAKDEPIITAMKRLSALYPRFGSRRIRIFLARENLSLGKDRCARLWALAGLQVPAKRHRKRIAAPRLPRLPAPASRHKVWCYDFVYDVCANGQVLKCLTVIDEFSRECLAIDVAGSIRSQRVIDILSQLISIYGAPKYLRSDNGPEFVSLKLLKWAQDQNLTTVLIEPGSPWQNGTNESFNGKFRDECLSMEWFRNRMEARVVINDWKDHYNSVRPHSSLNYQTPHEFIEKLARISNTEVRALN